MSSASNEAAGKRFQLQPRPANQHLDPCPICLEDQPQFAVQTSCGHYFCGRCFLAVWDDRALTRVACPMCRQSVTILFPVFTAQELAQDNAAGREAMDQVLTRLNRFNRYNSGRGIPQWDLIRDLPTIVPHIRADLFSPTGFSFVYLARIAIIGVICFAYVLSPLDILPEAVFGVLGFLDVLVASGGIASGHGLIIVFFLLNWLRVEAMLNLGDQTL